MTSCERGARRGGRGAAALARAALALAALAALAACTEAHPTHRFVATIPPLAFVLRELAGDTAVAVLLPPGASPHTYEPRPSDVAAAQRSAAFAYVAPALDGWAARLPARRRIEMFALVPPALRLPLPPPDAGEARALEASVDDGAPDPHFWMDPVVVRAVLPALTDSLCAVDPERCALYRGNAARFADTLRALDAELAATLAPLRGRAVVLFHPSMRYLLARYGIRVAAMVEPSPGQEPTPRRVEALAAIVRRTGATTIYTEPQLPRRPAEVIAELAHVRLDELDPLGGTPGRDTYAALLRYDAGVLRRSAR